MSKMSNLDLVLDEMITAGQKMIDAATALKEMFSDIAPAVRKIDTKTEKKEFIYLNLEKESDMPIRRECPKIILNLLSDTDDENSQEWRKQCHKSLQIKRKLLKLDGLPEGTRIQFPSLLSFSNGVEKGDSIILLKSNRKWIWEKYQYRFMKSYINPDYTILQKEEIK